MIVRVMQHDFPEDLAAIFRSDNAFDSHLKHMIEFGFGDFSRNLFTISTAL